jgi:hypothetical protein
MIIFSVGLNLREGDKFFEGKKTHGRDDPHSPRTLLIGYQESVFTLP